jgi:hypothetical protein
MRRIYVDAEEYLDGSDRKIKLIKFNGVEYIVRESYAIGGERLDDDKSYLVFLCRLGKKEVYVYCDQHDPENYRYFTLKE